MGKKSTKKVIPKTVAGVKIPKKLRKAGGKAVKAASEHPVIGDAVAAGLLAAAAALVDKKEFGDIVKKVAGKAEDRAGASRARTATRAAASAMRDALVDEFKRSRTGKTGAERSPGAR